MNIRLICVIDKGIQYEFAKANTLFTYFEL